MCVAHHEPEKEASHEAPREVVVHNGLGKIGIGPKQRLTCHQHCCLRTFGDLLYDHVVWRSKANPASPKASPVDDLCNSSIPLVQPLVTKQMSRVASRNTVAGELSPTGAWALLISPRGTTHLGLGPN